MKKIKQNNYAFIDSQNLNLGIREMGWCLDYKKFRKYLSDKYKVKTAYIFIGYIKCNSNMYKSLQKAGFILVFKPTLEDDKGKVKGNVDADLVLQAMIDIKEYDQAVIITSDGDFYCLVEYLYKERKLKSVLSPNREKCSVLLRKKGKEKMIFMNNIRKKLEYKKIPLKD